jgi:hypothetical protein
MTREALLDTLEATPLPPIAGQRVASEIASQLSDLSQLEKALISRFKSGHLSKVEQLKARTQIWSVIDATGSDPVGNARNRLLVCVVSDIDMFDDQLADMIYYWAGVAGIDDEVVSAAIRSEIAQW